MDSRSPLMNLVVANIARHMQSRGMSAAELNRRAKLNQTGVYDILNGKIAYPRFDTLEKIAAALGLPLQALLKKPDTDELTDELAQQLLALPPEARSRFLAMARAYLSADTQ